MTLTCIFNRPPPDFGSLTAARDIPALVRLLRDSNPQARLHAAASLGTIGDPGTVVPLRDLVYRETHVEIKLAGILALGGIGSPEAVPDLVSLLQDPDKYVRYGAALSLGNLGWGPPDETRRIQFRIALQDWDAVKAAGPAAVQPLQALSRDQDPATRSRVAILMGEIGAREGGLACEMALRDPNPKVRWAAVLAAMDCGIRPSLLPPFVAARERTGPDPVAAAVLNFLFLGIGYNYIGKWWGFPVFMTYMSILVLAQLAIGPLLPYLIAYPVTAVLGVHTYYLTRRMSDL